MTNSAKQPKSIILIPAYQPGRFLLGFTKQLLDAGFEVVVVDDGSEIEYQSIFSELDKRIHLLKHSVNKGKGAALKTGLRYIRDSFHNYTVITADADGQHHVADIKKVARAYSNHPHTLLLGSRSFESNTVPLKSKFGNVITREVFSLVTMHKLTDTQTGLRAFDHNLTDFMLDVPGDRFEYEMNVLLACSRANVTLVELPIKTIYKDNNESSHFNPIKDSWIIYRDVFKFISSSLIAFCIDIGIFITLVKLTDHWSLASSVVFANIVARIVSATFNFNTNKSFVFKHKGNVMKAGLLYTMLASGILLGNTILLSFLINVLLITPFIAKIVTELTFFLISYIVQKNLIFKTKSKQYT